MIAKEVILEIETVEDVLGLEVQKDAEKGEIEKLPGGEAAIGIVIQETEDLLALTKETEKGVAVDLTGNLENVEILETKEFLAV